MQVGVDVKAWFAAAPKATRMLPQKRPAHALGLAQPGGAHALEGLGLPLWGGAHLAKGRPSQV